MLASEYVYGFISLRFFFMVLKVSSLELRYVLGVLFFLSFFLSCFFMLYHLFFWPFDFFFFDDHWIFIDELI
jgi:hypothetical protein